MSLSEKQAIERIAEVDFEMRPQAGWQDAVRKQIREADKPTHLRLVELPVEPRRERPSFALAFSGFALAAAVILAFVFVQDQRRQDRASERKRAIAMVVEFVELETEMAQALAEIDSTQARMDEAYRNLQSAQEAEAALSAASMSGASDLPPVAAARAREQQKRSRVLKAKARAKSKKAKSRSEKTSASDPLAGL